MADFDDAVIGFDSSAWTFNGAAVTGCISFDAAVSFDADVSFDCGASTTPPEPGTPAVASIPGSGRRGPYTDELDTSTADRLRRIIQDEDILILL